MQQVDGYPGQLPPKKLDVSDVLKTSARAFQSLLAPGLLLLLLANLPAQLMVLGFQLFMSGMEPTDIRRYVRMIERMNPEERLTMGATFLAAYLGVIFLSMVFHLIAGGTVSHLALETLAGRKASVGGALRRTLSRFLTLFLASILISIATMLGLLAFCVGMFVVALFTFLTIPTIMGEDLGPVASVRRSVELVRSEWVMVLVLGLLAFAAIMGLSMVAGVITVPITLITRQANGQPGPVGAVINWLIGVLVGTPGGLFLAIVQTTIYVRLRGDRGTLDAAATANVFA